MIDAYLAVLRAQWYFLLHYGWVLLLVAAFFFLLHIILLSHRDSI